MKGFDYLNNDKFDLIWYGFDSSVIYNKETKQQEFVSNTDFGIPKRQRFTYKNRW